MVSIVLTTTEYTQLDDSLCSLFTRRALRRERYHCTSTRSNKPSGKCRKPIFSLENKIYFRAGNYVQLLVAEPEYSELLIALKQRNVNLNLEDKRIIVIQ